MNDIALIVELDLDKVIISIFGNSDPKPKKIFSFQEYEIRTVEKIINEKIKVIIAKNKVRVISFIIPFGGDSFLENGLIKKDFFIKIRKLVYSFPLQVPFIERIVKYFSDCFKGVPLIAFFETSFFSKLPQTEKCYALPFEYYDIKKIKKRGYHGVFHEYAAGLLTGKVVSIVLEKQTTVSAIENGKAKTISLGSTPLEGIMNRSSSGDIDPGIIFYLMKAHGLSIFSIDEILKRQSGFLGITGYDYSIKELYQLFGKDRKVTFAFDLYRNQILKYISQGIAVMGGLDGLCFSGKNVQAFEPIIFKLLKEINFLGVHLKKIPWQYKLKPFHITSSKSSVVAIINPFLKSSIVRRLSFDYISKNSFKPSR